MDSKDDPVLNGLVLGMAIGGGGALATAFVLLLPTLVRLF